MGVCVRKSEIGTLGVKVKLIFSKSQESSFGSPASESKATKLLAYF
jgi:hypothetical protein